MSDNHQDSLFDADEVVGVPAGTVEEPAAPPVEDVPPPNPDPAAPVAEDAPVDYARAPAGTSFEEPGEPADFFAPPPPLERPRVQRPPFVPSWVPVTAISVLVVLAFLIGAFVYSRAVSRIPVPNIVGQTLGVARTHLAENGLRLVISERRFSALAADTVLSQSPEQGARLRKGDAVSVVVSAGTEEFPMPDVVGDGILLARGVLETKGLEVRIEQQPSDAPSNTVIATNPAAGTSVRTGDIVRVTVAASGPGSSILVPYDMHGVIVTIDPAPTAAGQIDVPLEVGRRLESLLQASGGRIIMTRSSADTGTATTTAARAKRAAQGSPIVAIGLSVASSGEGGVVVSSPATGSPETVSASRRLSASLTTSLGRIGTSPKASLVATDAVVGVARAPWARIQLGSFASREDASAFRDPSWADNYARAIYRSLAELYGKKTRTQ